MSISEIFKRLKPIDPMQFLLPMAGLQSVELERRRIKKRTNLEQLEVYIFIRLILTLLQAREEDIKDLGRFTIL